MTNFLQFNIFNAFYKLVETCNRTWYIRFIIYLVVGINLNFIFVYIYCIYNQNILSKKRMPRRYWKLLLYILTVILILKMCFFIDKIKCKYNEIEYLF